MGLRCGFRLRASRLRYQRFKFLANLGNKNNFLRIKLI